MLSKQSPLHKESAICSRFIYKYGKKFRNDIGFQNLRKVNTALKKYLALNLLKHIEDFLLSLPTESDEDLYLPTRQMLEFVLLRVIAFSKIMLRVCVCSKKAAVFYLDRIKRGESHWMSLLPYALLSRLWSMSKVLLQHTTTWYSNLYPYLNKLQLKGMNFLPDNYKLPEDLEQWLDLKNIDEFGRFNWAQKKIIDIDHTLIDSDDNDLFDNILGYVNQINEDQAESDQEDIKPVSLLEKKQEVPLPVPTVTKIDYGVVISRESFNLLNTTAGYSQQTKTCLKRHRLADKKKTTLNKHKKKKYMY